MDGKVNRLLSLLPLEPVKPAALGGPRLCVCVCVCSWAQEGLAMAPRGLSLGVSTRSLCCASAHPHSPVSMRHSLGHSSPDASFPMFLLWLRIPRGAVAFRKPSPALSVPRVYSDYGYASFRFALL